MRRSRNILCSPAFWVPKSVSSAERCQRPWYCTRASGHDLALARLVVPRLEVREAHDQVPLERAVERVEGGVAQAHARRVADHGLVGGDAERAQLEQGAARLPRQRPLAPDHRGEVQQRGLVAGEAEVVGQLVGAARDAVAQGLVVAGVAGRVDGLERDAELADVVLVALELALEIGVVATRLVALPIALHRRQDLVLGQAGLGRQQREHEAEQALLDRDARSGGGGGHYFWMPSRSKTKM